MRVRGTVTAALAAIAFAAGCVAPPEDPPSAGPTIDVDLDRSARTVAATSVERRAQEVTVRIRSLGCDQLGLGSGFVLPGGLVVTNRHVLEQPVEVSINTWDGRSVPTEVDGVATDSDLAVLQLAEDVELPTAELRTDPVRTDEPVFAVGYPQGGPITVSAGRVVGLVDGSLLGEPADVIRIDAPIVQGNSGGPLLDADGLVVGVVFAAEPSRGTGLAVPVATLLQRLDGTQLRAPEGC
ncbi:MAG: trypsin-like peptidase domain-containing protein [Nitriliruptoraceae bacterium]|nr:trypsin-like peptidase domain-containing protein [Nitriliruptoraceae bacterium]